MGIKQRLEADIKAALLGGDKQRAVVLRTLKSVILDAEIATGKRQDGLAESELVTLLSKEAKKRQDAAELYKNAGEQDRAANELSEQAVISAYLPAQLTDDELTSMVDAAIASFDGELNQQSMGKLIGVVREKAAGKVDGSRIAAAVKARIDQA